MKDFETTPCPHCGKEGEHECEVWRCVWKSFAEAFWQIHRGELYTPEQFIKDLVAANIRLREELKDAADIIESLMSVQNGCPLDKYRNSFEEANRRGQLFVDKHFDMDYSNLHAEELARLQSESERKDAELAGLKEKAAMTQEAVSLLLKLEASPGYFHNGIELNREVRKFLISFKKLQKEKA